MKLTEEQLAIVQHDLHSHAKILAVAGSGKTSTMVERIEYLVRQRKVSPKTIRVVMFNKRIQEEFDGRIKRKGLDGIGVQTFHSLGHAICSWAVKQQLLPPFTISDDEADVDDILRAAIAEVLAGGSLADPDAQELRENGAAHIENLRTSISIWKGMMTPPERARHLTHAFYARVYAAYEVLRNRRSVLTFDDMIYEAVVLLETNSVAQKTLIDKVEHIIVDEFQDVNYSKQRLIQLLAGRTARVMVVGDDDQCIYEETFTHFPHAVYRLSRSFRFGPAIAQVAANCISRNTDREVKELVAHDVSKAGLVELHIAEDGGMSKEPVQQILRLREEGVPPGEIVVLVRNYIQSYGVQAALFAHGVPFFVDGEKPVVESFAIRCLRRYLALVRLFERPLCEESRAALEEVINRPKRYVNKLPFQNAVAAGLAASKSVRDFLEELPAASEGIQRNAFPNIRVFERDLAAAWQATHGDGEAPESGYAAAAALIDRIDFRSIFTEFQAEGRVEVNVQALAVFRELLRRCAVPLAGVEAFVKTFNPRRGQALGDCIKITSIFKEKGREYDHVIMPQTVEGQLPCHLQNENQATDTQYPERWPVRSSLIESERRLFYVAVTRARKAAYIFSSRVGNQKVSRFIHEAFVPQTVAAVNAAQWILRRGALASPDRRALCAAASHADLKAGVLSLLRDILRAAPLCEPVIQSLLPEVLAVVPAPFRYPEAYSDEATPQPTSDRSVGLPF